MDTLHILLTGFGIGVAVVLTDWLFVGKIFHHYQSETPATWRKESPANYMLSSLLSVLFGLLFAFFYAKVGKEFTGGNIVKSVELGLLCFGVFSFTTILSSAIYVNLSVRFVAGKLLSSLVSYLLAAFIASLFL